MYIAKRALTLMQSGLKSYGPSNIKRLLGIRNTQGTNGIR